MGEMQEEEEGKTLEEKQKGDELAEEVVADSAGNADCHPWPAFQFDLPPRRAYHLCRQFRSNEFSNNFLKGVNWSPDGSCFLTSSDDNTLRLFDLPADESGACLGHDAALDDLDSYSSSLIVREAEAVYDHCWFPYMCVSDPATCVFASTTRDHPIHLWDAFSGQLRCTYRAYDAMDEITAAISISFNSSGTKLFAGYNKFIRVFDVHRPGRDFEQYSLLKGSDYPSGIVSSIAFSPVHNGMLAIGSYSQITSVYAEDNMELLYILHGHIGGVTQVLFSKDGNYIYTGGRKDPYILCWDIRSTAGIVYKLFRSTESTNQRVAFDIEPSGRHLGTGGQDGLIHIYDLQTGEWKTSFHAASDTVNGISFHPHLPLAVTSSGHRRFSTPENSEMNFHLGVNENCASVWGFSCLDVASVAYSAPDDLPPRTEYEDLNRSQENP